jgi:hypothetical protein
MTDQFFYISPNEKTKCRVDIDVGKVIAAVVLYDWSDKKK